MKKVNKEKEPSELTVYWKNNPNEKWETLRNEEPKTYFKIREQCIKDQGHLCAFCEIKLPDTPLGQRVEHFHSKSDTNNQHNWHLDWQNLLAVCTGGSQKALQSKEDSSHYLEPLPRNLSCDAYKDYRIHTKKLPKDSENYILNPLELFAFPCLFDLCKRTGYLKPHVENCSKVIFENNAFESTEALVNSTIENLNLNCDRLSQQRLSIFWHYEHIIKQARKRKNRHIFAQLTQRWLKPQYKSFFTTRRIILNKHAENYLQKTSYNG